MITGDSYIGSKRRHRLSDQVSANTCEEHRRRFFTEFPSSLMETHLRAELKFRIQFPPAASRRTPSPTAEPRDSPRAPPQWISSTLICSTPDGAPARPFSAPYRLLHGDEGALQSVTLISMFRNIAGLLMPVCIFCSLPEPRFACANALAFAVRDTSPVRPRIRLICRGGTCPALPVEIGFILAHAAAAHEFEPKL